METPICDFVKNYAGGDALRVHMPGHKGASLLGFEDLDITEFDGADSLYEAAGIIAESEKNASHHFGAKTFYSTEGSSQCIRAMLHLARLHAVAQGKPPRIAAGRNAHKVFLSAAALLDLEVEWLYPEGESTYLSCPLDPARLDAFLNETQVAAVYVTSPDYLGSILDIAALAAVAHRHDCLLLVDNAHGAYLKFLPQSRHPMDLGADICCDSAHKTLPALTGSAYLHISHQAPAILHEQAKTALSLFGSTSPSYLILQSLDAVNGYLAEDYPQKLWGFIARVQMLKSALMKHGYEFCGAEPIKLTICAKAYGYTGDDLAAELLKAQIFCEFHDPDFLVMMLTLQNSEEDLRRLEKALMAIPKRAPIASPPPAFSVPERALSIRQAALSLSEAVPVEKSLGRVLAATTVACPPAVPIALCGERITPEIIKAFQYYDIQKIQAVL